MGVLKYKTENGWEYADAPASVKYVEQNLTEEQKAQARANIGISNQETSNKKIHYITNSAILATNNWTTTSAYPVGVTFGIDWAVDFGQLPKTWQLKTILIDLDSQATLEQRRAAEEACIYGFYHTMEWEDVSHYAVDIGITNNVAPLIDIPITATMIFEE